MPKKTAVPKEGTAVADSKKPKTAKKEREEQARDIVERYWEWIKTRTGHNPPDNFMGLKGIVEAALTAHFEPGQITRGLAKCRALRSNHDARARRSELSVPVR